MNKSDNLFELPPAEAILWRYIDMTKFLSLLHSKALFFVRSDKLGDPFEGSFSRVNIDLRPHLYGFDVNPNAEKHFSNFYAIMKKIPTICRSQLLALEPA